MPVVVEDIQHKISRAVISFHVVDIQAVSVGTAPRFECAVYVFTDVLDFAVLYLHNVLIDFEVHQEVTVWTAFNNQIRRTCYATHGVYFFLKPFTLTAYIIP